MFERALKICKKIRESREHVGNHKKRPFVGKNNKKNASGGLRPPVGGPSGHLGGLATPSRPRPEQILRPSTPNLLYSQIPHHYSQFPINLGAEKKEEEEEELDFFGNYNILL